MEGVTVEPQNRGYRRVMKQSYSHQKRIPVFSVLFKSCLCSVCLSERLISSRSFKPTPPVSVRTHRETWHPNRTNIKRVRGDVGAVKRRQKEKTTNKKKNTSNYSYSLCCGHWTVMCLESSWKRKRGGKEGTNDRGMVETFFHSVTWTYRHLSVHLFFFFTQSICSCSLSSSSPIP